MISKKGICMMLKWIKLNNIRSYTSETIEFPEGSVLLSGDIGAGKSTILLAAEFALFGMQRGDISGSELLRHGKDSGSVELAFSVNGMDCIVKRNLRRGKSISQDTCQLEAEGRKYDYTPTEMKSKIFGMLGYPLDAMSRNIPIFRFTVYTPQEQMKHIMLSDEDRLNALRKIFNMDKYGRIRSNVKLFVSELRSMKRELDAYSRDVEEKTKERDEALANREKLSGDAAKISVTINAVDREIEKKNFERDSAKKKLLEFNRLKQALAEKEAALRNEEYKIARAAREMERLDERIAEAAKEAEKYAGLQKPAHGTAELGSMLKELESEKSRMLAEKMSTEREISGLKAVYEKGVCSVCGQKVSDPGSFSANIGHKTSHIKELSSTLMEKESEISDITMEKDCAVRYQYESASKARAEKELAGMLSERESTERDMSDLKACTAKMREELDALKPKIESTSQMEKDYEKLEAEMKKLASEKLEHEKTRSRLEQGIGDLERSISSLEKIIGEKKRAREKIARISEITNWLEEHFAGLAELIEKHVMLTIQKEFDFLFQEWFNIMMQDENLRVRIDENFAPVIMQNGFETSYQNLSGGEKTSVALAYRLALNKVINALIETIKTKDLLILDEPTDGLSSEQLDRIRDVLNELKLRQIIIVSHEPKIDTFVSSVIRFYKENHVSRISR